MVRKFFSKVAGVVKIASLFAFFIFASGLDATFKPNAIACIASLISYLMNMYLEYLLE